MTALVLLGLMASTPADHAVVPVELQVELLARVLRYDRNFSERVSDEVRVVVVYAPAAAESLHLAQQFLTALQARPRLGGVAHREELVRFSTVEHLAALVKERGAAVVVFAPDLAPRAPDFAVAFAGCDCLTVSSTPEGVREGLVLGFDLVSGKPRMLFNLGQARRQHADFRAEVLQLMTVFP